MLSTLLLKGRASLREKRCSTLSGTWRARPGKPWKGISCCHLRMKEAKKLLEERYVSPFIVGNAFRDKFERRHKIGPKDGVALRKFAYFLQQCVTAMDVVDSLFILNDERQNKKILEKFPDWIMSRWARIVNDWRDRNGQFPPCNVFAVCD